MAAFAARMPAVLWCAAAASSTRPVAARNSGQSNCSGTPSANDRSSGPTNNTSTPSWAAISSTASNAASVSIWITRRVLWVGSVSGARSNHHHPGGALVEHATDAYPLILLRQHDHRHPVTPGGDHAVADHVLGPGAVFE